MSITIYSEKYSAVTTAFNANTGCSAPEPAFGATTTEDGLRIGDPATAPAAAPRTDVTMSHMKHMEEVQLRQLAIAIDAREKLALKRYLFRKEDRHGAACCRCFAPFLSTCPICRDEGRWLIW